ncbi:MAG: hypothetical protein J7K72_04680 [Candidatus Aenigmarchaeota archaeon]|nr:hypothetical protein [Candidatus Aenigmarchaeota archaeon]
MNFIQSAVTKNVVLPKDFKILDEGKPKKGDVILVRFVSEGEYEPTYIRDKHGEKVNLKKGLVFLSALSNRYAPTIMKAEVPEYLKKGDKINLLARGGTTGVITEGKHNYRKAYVEFIGFVKKGDKILNIKDFSILAKDIKNIPKLIIIVGVFEGSGKTTTCENLTKGLVKKGYKVCVGKISGLGNVIDVKKSKDKGASKILEIVDTGYPSTVGLSKDELDEIFLKIFSNLADENPDFILIEIADGVTQRETSMYLKSEIVRKYDPHFIVSVLDPLGACGSLKLLEEKLNIRPLFFTGKGAITSMARNEIEQVTGLKAFDPTTQWKEMTDYMLSLL